MALGAGMSNCPLLYLQRRVLENVIHFVAGQVGGLLKRGGCRFFDCHYSRQFVFLCVRVCVCVCVRVHVTCACASASVCVCVLLLPEAILKVMLSIACVVVDGCRVMLLGGVLGYWRWRCSVQEK